MRTISSEYLVKEPCKICCVDVGIVTSVGRSEEALQHVLEQQPLQLNEGLRVALAHFKRFHSLYDAGAIQTSVPVLPDLDSEPLCRYVNCCDFFFCLFISFSNFER